MSRVRDTLVSLSLLGMAFTGPAAVAAYLMADGPGAEPLMLAAAGDGGTATSAAQPRGVPVLSGVLYTRGSPQVDWNGSRIPVSDGSYAYLGGEMVSTGAGDMGVLQLDGDNVVYMCPGSRMSVTRGADGTYDIRIAEGIGRFVFAPGTGYRIEANRGVYSPGPDARSQPTVVEIAVFRNHPGGVVCGFSSSLDVAGYSEAGGAPVALGNAGPGEIIDLSRALKDEAAASGTPVIMQPIAMPASVQSWLRNNAPYPPQPGPIGYLCRCEELKRYAEADGIPDAAIVPRMSPPAAELTPAPALPPAVLAMPGIPDNADPAVLPVPPVPLTVPAPLVPVIGSGGGYTSTPS